MDRLYLTGAGEELVAKLMAGEDSARFTKIATSSHEYAQSDIAGLTSLDDVKQSVSVSDTAMVDGTTVKIEAAFNNTGLSAGYYIRTVGVYAKDGAENEILFGVAIDNEHPDYLYPYAGQTVTGVSYSFNIGVGAASKIDVTVDPAAVVTVSMFTGHTEGAVGDSDGVHGFRVVDGKPQYKNGESWESIAAGGSTIKVITEDEALLSQNVTISQGSKSITGTFSSDGVCEFSGIDWTGVITVSAMAGETEVSSALNVPYYGTYSAQIGRVLYIIDITTTEESLYGKEITITNGEKTKTAAFDAIGRTTTTIAFEGAVAVSATDGEKTATAEITVAEGTDYYSVSLAFYSVYSVIIDHSKSDPTEMVSYADGASGMTKGDGAWWDMPIFKDIRPCVLADGGTVSYYLNPNDYTKRENGASASITTVGSDVMVEIPRCGVKAEWLDDNRLKISVTEAAGLDGYDYGAFSYNSKNDCDKIYIGAYLGYLSGNKLYSVSGQTPTGNKKIGEFRTYAAARGTGYVQAQDSQVELLDALYLIFYGSLDSQTAVGRGYVDGNSAATSTGNTNAYGMNSEIIKSSQPTYMTDGKHQIKCLGIEDFWGNLKWWADGMLYNSSRDITRTPYATACNDSGTNYETLVTTGLTNNVSGYASKVWGVTGAPFVTKEASGSESTYYADHGNLWADRVPLVGGHWSDAGDAGAFSRRAGAVSYAYAGIGARLCYMHVEG